MGTHTFARGAQFELERKFYRLTRKISDNTWQAEESRTLRATEFKTEQLRKLLTAGDLKFIETQPAFPNFAASEYVDPTDKRFDRANVRLEYLKAIKGLPSTRRVITPLIRQTWNKLQAPSKKAPPSAATVLRWRASHDKSGKVIFGLFDGIAKRGPRGSKYSGEVQEIIEQAIDKKYMCLERGTIQDTVDEAAAQVARANKLRPASDQLPIPTYRCVRRMIAEISAFDQHAARYGRDAAIRKFRGAGGLVIVDKPLARVEIDHTVIDLTVVDEHTGLPLGRPFLTACIDAYTRCVLGIHISFDPPSYLTVARCLKHAILPKDGLRENYTKIENDWNAYGVMTELVVDNGPEFHSQDLRNACQTLGIEVNITPRRKPWFKGRIERFFGTLNRGVAHKTPGTNFASILERGDYDAAASAVVSYGAFEEGVFLWICDYYHKKPHRALNTSPAEMWSRSISDDDILLPADASLLDAILASTEERRLTPNGIEYEGLFYWSPELKDLLDRHGAKLDVEIRVDRGDLGSIVVLKPGKTGYIKVPAKDKDYATGLSLWQHKVIKKYAANQLKKFDNSGWREAKLKLAELVDEQFVRQKSRTKARMARFKGDKALKKGAATATPTLDSPVEATTATVPPSSAGTAGALPPRTATSADAEPVVEKGPPQEAESTAPRKAFVPRVRERKAVSIPADPSKSSTDK